MDIQNQIATYKQLLEETQVDIACCESHGTRELLSQEASGYELKLGLLEAKQLASC